ncbi:MAG: alpha/beta hydrolase [Proteobacteria bacterium]|nr:alpha/beta hydrolase [Pseudomonadota bacterium]MBU1389762.1 alpha/beta hydrolase [Pseudomonadota bacterium]MBU1543771.1 alpha/beta hydrolase [Pseudomonadota bacterium]MBU2429975.1 alpha/beta hydrolase [Pseudomonadota bacterium]MBU2480126.1 alpha/beta hydrolase [Pseudomonadota bacterium]
MPYADIDGCNYYYEVTGNGDPLVMIRGLGSNLDHWYPQIQALTQHFRVMAFDNPGIARTKDVIKPYSILKMAQNIPKLMDVAGIEKAHVFGLSMGGMIAQELALNFPERIQRLILCVTHCGKSHSISPSDKVNQLFAAMIKEGTDEARAAAAAVMFAQETLENNPETAAEYAGISMKYPVSTEILVKQSQAIQEFDTWERLTDITPPTLVLGADKDVLIPPENLNILADRIPNAKLHFIKGGGHQVMIEQPDDCNTAIIDFLT